MPKPSALKSKPKIKPRKKRRQLLTKSQIIYIKRAFLVLGLFAVSSVSLVSYTNYRSIMRPLVSADSISAYDIQNLDVFTYALIYVDDLDAEFVNVEKVEVLLIDKNNERVLGFDFPVDVEFKMPGRYGNEPLSKVVSFGMLHKDGSINSGVTLLNDVLELYLGFKIDRYIMIESSIRPSFESVVFDHTVKRAPLKFIRDYSSNVQTNSNFSEVKYTFELVKSFPSNSFTIRALNDSWVTDTSEIDNLFQEVTFGTEIALEAKSVSILNASRTPGLANYGSRVVKNRGGRVISVGNSIVQHEETLLIVDDANSETAKYIARFFDIKPTNVVLKENAAHIQATEINRSDIVLFLVQ